MADKGLRYPRIQLLRLKNQMASAVGQVIDFETLSKLQALVDEFRAVKQKYDTTLEAVINSSDDTAENYQKSMESLTKDAAGVSDVLATYEAKIRNFHRTLEGQSNRDSLLPSELNQTFRTPSSIQPKVEKIKVPTFNGNILDFQNWKGLFENLVHSNGELSNVQKLYYLKQSLVENAAELIRDFELTDNAYAQAWACVVSRYENKRLVVKTLFRKLISVEQIKNDQQIRNLLDQFDVIIRSFRANGERVEGTFSKFVAFYLASRLDLRTAKDFENSLESSASVPDYECLRKFLNVRALTAEEYAPKTTKITVPENKTSTSSNSSPIKAKEKRVFTLTTSKTLKCVVCSQAHYLNQCDKFLNQSVSDRFSVVKNNKLCVKCFSPFHRVADCSRPNCASCGGNHHKYLHREESSPENSKPSTSKTVSQQTNDKVSLSVVSNISQKDSKTIVLPTAVVSVRIPTKVGERSKFARIMLDHGSQVSMISEDFVRRNSILVQKSQHSSRIGGITGNSVLSKFFVEIELESRHSSFRCKLTVEVVPEIPYSVKESLIVEAIKARPNVKFAETGTHSDRVDIIVGAEYYEMFVRNRSEKFGTVFLRDTEFGWVISGPVVVSKFSRKAFCGFTVFNVQEQLRKFWEIEEIDIPQTNKLQFEHQRCNEFVSQTLERNENGRFVAKLPLKIAREELGESRNKAISALKRIESKYDAELRKQYVAVMEEYLQLDHMQEIRSNSSRCSYYIPHRAVVKLTSTTTKVRVVFNASCSTSIGMSLNDALMVGPTIQPELVETLIRFRSHMIAFTCDVTKMYRQILVHPDDCDLQRIVWRFNTQQPINEYQLATLTFGTGSASFIATKCLEVLSNSIADQHQEASRAISQDFVMDDLLTGASNVESAIKLQRTIHEVLASAHFPLRKYMSNSTQFLAQIDSSLVEKTSNFVFGQKNAISLLGLFWQPGTDKLAVKLQLREDQSVFAAMTKRLLLSEIARVYDPIGVIAPVTIRAKILLQEVWKENRNWDDVVSSPIISSFRKYYNELSSLSSFSIQRCYSSLNEISEAQLIGFSDASERAYAAVVYFRSVDKYGNVDSYFVVCKTKVAPRNEFKLTIPKLELQAAELLSRSIKKVANVLKVNSCFAFTDSTTVLSWLNGDVNRWSLFVQNRIRKITGVVDPRNWSHVESKQNPADLATRGISVRSLVQSKLWTKGPNFLRENLDSVLANSRSGFVMSTNLPEQRKIAMTVVLQTNETNDHLFEVIEKHSNFVALINVFVIVYKFIGRRIPCVLTDYGDITDLSKIAFYCIIRVVQRKFYEKEICAVTKGQRLSKNSPLYGLDLFLDNFNVLRSKSRLENSLLSYEFRNLIILPSKCHLLKILVIHIHERFFHASLSFVLNYLKSMYLVRGGLVNRVKCILFDCIKCKKLSAKTLSQKMGQLPAVRVVADRPFNNVGVDLAGPFSVKCVGHRTTKFGKIYAAVFVCMCTKAVHIEVLSALSTESFIATLDRFVARRGVPSNIYSDNATNFVGCNALLRSIHNRNFRWHFIPPRTPHQGGLWEAAVKSAKKYLIVVTNGQTLNYEEYSTVFTSIESILNSRPLCHSSGHVLTPAHFLTGSNLLFPSSIPEHEQPKSLGQRFRLQQNIIRSFWNIWSKDYLNQLRNSNKWRNVQDCLRIGDIVLVKEDTIPVFKWPIGRIEKTFPGEDRLVRVVDVRFRNSVKRRSVNSLVLLISGDAPHPHRGE